MDDTIQDGICMSGIGESRKPLTHRDLGSHQGGDTPKAIVEDFEQVAGFGSGDGIAHPVIEDEQVYFCQAGEQGVERAIQVRLGQMEQEA